METNGTAADANPRSHGSLGHDMNRPFEYAVFEPDGTVIAATQPSVVFSLQSPNVGHRCHMIHPST